MANIQPHKAKQRGFQHDIHREIHYRPNVLRPDFPSDVLVSVVFLYAG